MTRRRYIGEERVSITERVAAIPASITFRTVARLAALSALALVSACVKPPVPIASKPPAPETVDIPPVRPRAPGAAAPSFQPPQALADGTRLTLNYGLSPDQTTWHLRSAWNVAALNCNGPAYEPIATAYASFLDSHAPELKTINTALDRQFRTEHGTGYARVRDTYMTRVYNYFALPPAKRYFCDAALGVANRHTLQPPAELNGWSAIELATIERAFAAFYNDFEQWQVDVAAWDQAYGAEYGAPYGVYPQSFAAPAPITIPSVDPGSQPTNGEVVQPVISLPVEQPTE